MTTPSTPAAPEDLDLLLAAWLDADAQVREARSPARPDVLARTSRSAPAARLAAPRRWLPMQLALRAQPRVRLVPLLIALAVIAAALVAVALFAGSRRHVPGPFGLAANGQIAFIRDGKLVRENPDGSETVTVLPNSMAQQAPTFSRDGTKIVYKNVLEITPAAGYAERVDVVVADADGSHPLIAVHNVSAGNPVLRPTGGGSPTPRRATMHSWLLQMARGRRPTSATSRPEPDPELVARQRAPCGGLRQRRPLDRQPGRQRRASP